MDRQLAAFLVFTAILVLTPGATTAVVVRNVLDGGRRGGIAAAFGAALANSTYALAAALGLAAAFARAPLRTRRFAMADRRTSPISAFAR